MTRNTLELYLVRHAIAADRGKAWPNDDARPLTREGIRRFKDVVKGLVRLDVELDLILTSPLTRAEQTAELLSAGLRGKPTLKVVKALAPGTPPADVVSALFGSAKQRRLAVVGHEPDLGQLAAFLIGIRRPILFKKGGVCRIDLPAVMVRSRGTLIWFATPKLLRLIGRP